MSRTTGFFGALLGWRRRRADRARSIRLTGPSVRAKVIEVKPSKGSNVHDYYDAILCFTDPQRIERHHKAMTRTHKPYVGSRHWIRYDPKKPGRKSEWDPSGNGDDEQTERSI